MNEAMKVLQKYFPDAGTAETEADILANTFVKDDDTIAAIINPPAHSPRLLVGKKGAGKTAVLAFVARGAEAAKIPCVRLEPDDLAELDSIASGASAALITKCVQDVILKSLAAKIGSQRPRYLPLFTEDQKRLHELAVEHGLKERDLVERAATFLSAFGAAVGAVDFSKLLSPADTALIASAKVGAALKTPPARTSSAQLRAAIAANVPGDKLFYVLIDDTDQVAAPQNADHLNRLWGTLLALRKLTIRFPALRCIISLRTEIWQRMGHESRGQRDQIDHFDPLVFNLNPSKEDVRRIILRRMEVASANSGSFVRNSPYEVFFDKHDAAMPMSKERRSWDDLVVERSRERPRDAIQLINMLSRSAETAGRSKITEEDLALAMPTYSARRVKYLADEYASECPQIRELVREVSKFSFDPELGGFCLGADSFKDQLARVLGRFAISVFGEVIKSDRPDSVFIVWRLLFDTGVINACISDVTRPKHYRFVSPTEDPTLVVKERWNDMQRMVWAVNPAYRDFAIGVQAEQRNYLGLPRRDKRKKL